ncbi:MAG: amino acid ABC transporter permease [Chloroflexi bacterium CFX4]|nr:amino acid ABC transporter permease [Chloroflexi bacterium CFX4]MDL1924239.1 amino acid ABC transporter permease [Chloroflexi bacterium CFX3]
MSIASSHREVANIPLLEQLAMRVARLPWWVIIIVVGLVLVFYSFFTSPLYRRALIFVTDDPRLTTTRFANVIYDVRTEDGATRRIEGVFIGQTGDLISVETKRQVTIRVPRRDIATLTCEPSAAAEDCPTEATITLLRAQISGALTFEDLGRFRIVTDDGERQEVQKFNVLVDAVTRIPEGCAPSADGRCRVVLPLKPEVPDNTLTGIVLEADSESFLVEFEPEVIVQVREQDILTVLRYAPAECALNNLAGCDSGIFLTLFVAIVAFAVAVVIGLVAGLMRISSNPILFNASTIYVEVLRGVPLLVTLLFVNFALYTWLRDDFPQLAPTLQIGIGLLAAIIALTQAWNRRALSRTEPSAFLQPIIAALVMGSTFILILGAFAANSDLPPLARGILGLAICYGAYLAELFRAGIQSIGRGQMEAARSLGMSYLQAMRYIILPQAFRVVLPPLGNEFIAMLKDTALLTVIALPEMTQRARLFAADTFRVFEPYITIGALYLCMTLLLSVLVRAAERRLALPH